MQTAVKLFQVMQQIQKQHHLSEITVSIFLYEKHEIMIVSETFFKNNWTNYRLFGIGTTF